MIDKSTPGEVQDHFYDAFSRGDLDAMMTVWAAEADIVCVHPGSVPVVGVAPVRLSWQKILGSEENLKITSSPLEHWMSGDIATFVVTEHLYLPSQNIHAETLATNVFRKRDSLWEMVLHHGSAKPREARSTQSSGSHGVH